MRGDTGGSAAVFSYTTPAQRVPQDHPLRTIRARGTRRCARCLPSLTGSIRESAARQSLSVIRAKCYLIDTFQNEYQRPLLVIHASIRRAADNGQE